MLFRLKAEESFDEIAEKYDRFGFLKRTID